MYYISTSFFPGCNATLVLEATCQFCETAIHCHQFLSRLAVELVHKMGLVNSYIMAGEPTPSRNKGLIRP